MFSPSRGIEWRFNPPYPPWWGLIFEKLSRAVKGYLKKVLMNSRVTFEEMETTIKEFELPLNNRSLAFAYENSGDEVLTPNYLTHRFWTNITSS